MYEDYTFMMTKSLLGTGKEWRPEVETGNNNNTNIKKMFKGENSCV